MKSNTEMLGVNNLLQATIWSFQFVSNLRGKSNSAIFSPPSHQLQRGEGGCTLNINTTAVNSLQTRAEENPPATDKILITFPC